MSDVHTIENDFQHFLSYTGHGMSVPADELERLRQAYEHGSDRGQNLPISGMSFGVAIESLKAGKRVARSGWNGKGMWLVLDPGSVVAEVREGSAYHKAGVTGSFTINPHIDMRTATGEMQPGWLASQTDMLADDWKVV